MSGAWTFYSASGAIKTTGEQGAQGEPGDAGPPGASGVTGSAIIWSSRYKFGIGVGRRLYIPHDGTITEVRLYSTDAAPTSSVTADLLVNGSSVLASSLFLNTGDFLGDPGTVDSPDVVENDYIQFEVLNAGSLAGPLSGRIKFEWSE